MTDREILTYIDRGANDYVSLFGRAEHMEDIQKEYYSYVRPKGDVYGIQFVYNVRLEECPVERRAAVAEEIKALHMPVWLDLTSSDESFRLIFGREKVHGQRELGMEDEVYMAMLPEEMPAYEARQVREVETPEEFAAWAGLVNGVLTGGNQDLHPVYHYPLCRDGRLRCFLYCEDGVPVSACALAWGGEAPSLEFVVTAPHARRRGLARNVCQYAVKEAFRGDAKLVTVRAIDGRAGGLYRSIGFRDYNHAI